MTVAPTDIFAAIQAALAGECADPYETAQRLEQRLHKAGYAILPVGCPISPDSVVLSFSEQSEPPGPQ